MSNRKKARMDAIEHRLAYLEGLAEGDDPNWRAFREMNPDPPEFSCQPRPDPREEAQAIIDRAFRPVPDDVRERVRERSDLADAAAQMDADSYWHAHATRYAVSLAALRDLLQPDAIATLYAPDAVALISGVLDGGTITPEGLRDA